MKLGKFLFAFAIVLLLPTCSKESEEQKTEVDCLIQTSEIVGGEADFQFKWAFNCTMKYIQVSILNGFGQEVENFQNIDALRAFDLQNLQPENEQSVIYYWLAEFETEENPGLHQSQRGKFTYLAN